MSRYCDPQAERIVMQDPIVFEGKAPLYATFHSENLN